MKTKQQAYKKLADAMRISSIYLKREDQHPYGSHKGRSIPLMMKHYNKQEGVRSFCISSSGNAALAAAIAAKKHNQNNSDPIHLHILVGKHIDPKKLTALTPYLTDSNITIEQTERPKQTAMTMEAAGKAHYLRQSTDDLALRGYYELAAELGNIPNLNAIFIPSSSGTTAEGIGSALQETHPHIQIHIVQTPSCHPLVDAIAPQNKKELPSSAEASLASAIVDTVAHRKNRVATIVHASHGGGWIATNAEITEAIALVQKNTGISLSPNSALSIVGVQQAIQHGYTWDGPVVCLITGA